MAVTRAQVETILLRRCSTALEKAGLDHLTDNGTNVDLNDPIGYAVRTLGGSVVTITAVDDADLGTVGAATDDALLDLAEYRALETIQNTVADLVSTSVGPQRQELQQWGAALDARLQRLDRKLERIHAIGRATLSAGVIDLDFMEKSGDA